MTERLAARFARSREEGRAALVTYVMAGDPDPADRRTRSLRDLQGMLLGFDLPSGDATRAVAGLRDGTGGRQAGTVLVAELAVLRAFADVAELTRNRPEHEDDGDGVAAARRGREDVDLAERAGARHAPHDAGARSFTRSGPASTVSPARQQRLQPP